MRKGSSQLPNQVGKLNLTANAGIAWIHVSCKESLVCLQAVAVVERVYYDRFTSCAHQIRENIVLKPKDKCMISAHVFNL